MLFRSFFRMRRIALGLPLTPFLPDHDLDRVALESAGRVAGRDEDVPFPAPFGRHEAEAAEDGDEPAADDGRSRSKGRSLAFARRTTPPLSRSLRASASLFLSFREPELPGDILQDQPFRMLPEQGGDPLVDLFHVFPYVVFHFVEPFPANSNTARGKAPCAAPALPSRASSSRSSSRPRRAPRECARRVTSRRTASFRPPGAARQSASSTSASSSSSASSSAPAGHQGRPRPPRTAPSRASSPGGTSCRNRPISPRARCAYRPGDGCRGPAARRSRLRPMALATWYSQKARVRAPAGRPLLPEILEGPLHPFEDGVEGDPLLLPAGDEGHVLRGQEERRPRRLRRTPGRSSGSRRVSLPGLVPLVDDPQALQDEGGLVGPDGRDLGRDLGAEAPVATTRTPGRAPG